jgi:hypothetical protein
MPETEVVTPPPDLSLMHPSRFEYVYVIVDEIEAAERSTAFSILAETLGVIAGQSHEPQRHIALNALRTARARQVDRA